jgi:tetratricopeptide (TPR) repeat protein
MSMSKQHQLLQRVRSLPARSVIPAAAGCIMLFGSFLPWLVDPLAGSYSAWKLPVDIGWQFRANIFSYGLLCLCCAALALFTAYVNWKPSRRSRYFTPGYASLGVLCMVPFFLFSLQYLFADVHGVDVLGQHLIQELLVQQHFGYSVTSKLIPLSPFTVTTATLSGRFKLLVDLVSFGPFTSLASGGMLIGCRRLLMVPSSTIVKKRRSSAWYLVIPFACLPLLAVLGRAPAAMTFNYLAKSSLAAGDAITAMKLLDVALILNPALDQVPYYHIERGQANYGLNPNDQSDVGRAYLASVYHVQGDDLDADQEVLALWHAHPTAPWVVDELSITLETQAEFIQHPNAPPIARADNDIAAMTWLQILAQTDASNVYAQYLIGRIQYYLHSYSACIEHMARVIQLSRNADIQSSAYTYMGLSVAGQGDIVGERRFLFEAAKLDTNYYNNTAREELSGLH